MAYGFNAEEVLEMAIRIEKNGAAFYRKAASLQKDEASKTFLETLAAMEDRHQAGFEGMKRTLSEADRAKTVFDPQDELLLYLKAMADAHGGEGSPDAANRLTGEESMAQVIETAIGLEKESILFYVGLKDVVPPDMGREKIDAIIAEERKHVAQLNGFLSKAKK
jgi:rubrerythrin